MRQNLKKKKIWEKLVFLSVPLALAALIITFVSPFASYKYKSKPYMLTGTDFLTGADICKGNFRVKANGLIWISVICLVLLIVDLLVLYRKRKKMAAGFGCLFSGVPLVLLLTFQYATIKNFQVAKSVKALPAVYACIILTALCFALAVYEVRRQNILSSLHFMLVPGFIYLIINNYIPMFGIFIAFKKIDYAKGIFKSDWVGFNNFKYLFSTNDAWLITRNTILYNVAFIIIGMFMGLFVGWCLYEVFSQKLQKVYQTTILIPQLISIVIVAYIVYAFLSNESGLINGLLGEDRAIAFYATPKYWPFILTFVHIWKGLGYNAIIYLSSICGIDKNLYEAAKIDGASKWQQITNVMIPQLKPTMITLFILSCGRIFYSDFGLFYQVTQHSGALANVTNTIDVYVYKALMVNNNISTSSAAGAFQAVIGLILVVSVNALVKKLDRDNALF